MATDAAMKRYEEKEAELTPSIMREVERAALLRVVDTKWMQHIDDMAELKRGIALRSYSGKDPVVAYRFEGFEMFDEMVASICEDTVRMLYHVRVQKNEEVKREQVLKPDNTASDGSVSATRRNTGKVGRNDPCPCGSGKKYKKCCGQ